ncbi:MAG TPA: hypothetical protein VJC03_00400 [bacterium]|nr:hypothetical protein [bacterium]
MLLEFKLNFDKCPDKEKCRELLRIGLKGENENAGQCFNAALTGGSDFSVCPVPADAEALLIKQKETHKGNVVREIRKAEQSGFYSHFLNYFNYIPDIVDINRSKTTRGGKEIRYFYSCPERYFGPRAERNYSIEETCAGHYISYFGVFTRTPGRKLGRINVDEKLLGYIRVFRLNDLVWYNMIQGHGDYLDLFVMHKMHFDLIKHYMAMDPPPKYLVYGIARDDKRQLWKRKALFEPGRIKFDDLDQYYTAFKEEERRSLTKQAAQYLHNGRFMLSEAVFKMLRSYPDKTLRARCRRGLNRLIRKITPPFSGKTDPIV